MENSSFCSNPIQCTAIHSLATNLGEMNLKLTSVMSLLQMFFQEWKAETGHKEKEPSRDPLSGPNRSNEGHPTVSVKVEPSDDAIEFETVPSAGSLAIGVSVEEAEDCFTPSAGEPRFGSESSFGHPQGFCLPVTHSAEGGANGQANFLESYDMSSIPSTSASDHRLAGFLSAEELMEMNGMGGLPKKRKKLVRDKPRHSLMIPGSLVWTMQPEPLQIKKVVLLFPGKLFTRRLLTRFGPLCKFRKRNLITFQDIVTHTNQLQEEGLLKMSGIKPKLGHQAEKFAVLEKVSPDTPGLAEKLETYGVAMDEYSRAYNEPLYGEVQRIIDKTT